MANFLFLTLFISAGCDKALAQDFDDAKFIVPEQSLEVIVHKNGTSEESVTNTLQAVSDGGRIELSLRKEKYNGALQKLSVEGAWLISGGQESPIEMKNIRDEAVAGNSPGLQNLREITIPFEGVKINSRVKYKYSTKTSPMFPGFYFSGYVYGVEGPELNSKVKIKSEIPLKLEVHDPQKYLAISETTNGALYIYELKQNRPAYFSRDEKNPNILATIPRVQVYSVASWSQLEANFMAQLQPRLAENLPDSAALFLETIKTKSTDEKISMIREWIIENLNYSGRWLSPESSWVPRRMQETVSSKVGDCKDFALLFVKMLRSSGIKAQFVATRARPTPDFTATISQLKSLADLNAAPIYFDHAVAMVTVNGTERFLDPTLPISQSKDSDFHLHDKLAWIFESNGEVLRNVQLKGLATSSINVVLERSVEGFRVFSKMTFTDQFASYLQFIRLSLGDEKFRSLLADLGGFPKSENLKIDLPKANRRAVTLTFEITGFDRAQFLWDSSGRPSYVPHPLLPSVDEGQMLSLVGVPMQFPYQLTRSTIVPKYNLEDETAGDCYAFTPLIRHRRIFKNYAGNFAIMEKTSTYDRSDRKSWTDPMGNLLAIRNELKLCGSEKAIVLTGSKVEKVISIDDSFSTEPETPHLSTAQWDKDSRRELRRLFSLVEKYPTNAQYEFWLGRLLYLIGKNKTHRSVQLAYGDLAKETLESGLRKDPNSDLGWTFLGRNALDLLIDEATAKQAFQKAYKINPRSRWASILGGDLCHIAKRYDDAFKYYQLAEPYSKTVEEKKISLSRQARSLTASHGDDVRIEPIIEKLISLESTDSWNLEDASMLYAGIKKYEKAIEMARKSLEIDRQSRGKLRLGQALAMASSAILKAETKDPQKIKEAELYISEAATLDSEKSDFNIQLGIAQFAIAAAELSREDHLIERCRSMVPILKSLNYSNLPVVDAYEKAVERLEMKTFRKTASGQTLAETLNKAFPSAFALSQSDLVKPGGRNYDHIALKNVGQLILTAAGQCALEGTVLFKSVVTLDSLGRVRNWENEKMADEYACMKSKLTSLQLEKPPFAPFHLLIEFRLREMKRR